MNSSIFAIFISATCIFIFCLIIYFLQTKRFVLLYEVPIVQLIVAALIYICFHGRAALIGSCATIIYLFFSANNIRNREKIKISITLLLLTIVFFCFVKKDSSHGRLVVYKVVFSQLTFKNYINGFGVGKFKAEYNKLQAAYFEKNNLNEKEVLLAGNGYYLFNDWLQFALEIGLVRLFALTSFIFLVLKFFYWNPHKESILIATNAVLVCIGTAAFFSYPLQVPITRSFFLICLYFHFYYSWSVKEKYNLIGFQMARRIVLAIALAFTLIKSVILYWYDQKSKQAFELSRDGFKEEAEVLFIKLEKYPVEDYNTHYNYAFLLYCKNDLKKALEQIDKSLDLAYSATSVKLKADILYELNDFNQAELFYKQAVYITPGRMMPKFNLLRYYIKRNKVKLINYWAGEILNMPIKITSETTENVRNEAKRILKMYSR